MSTQKLNAFEIKRIIKIVLLLLALLISVVTLFLSQRLVNKIAAEETKKMEIWADAEHILSDPESEGDLGFHLKIIQSNTTIPAILVSETGRVIQHINLQKEGTVKKISDHDLLEKIEEFKSENIPIDIPIDEKTIYKVYYGKSTVLKQLEYYPYVVLGIVALFMLVSYVAFSYSTRSEQNQVWVGMAKETAHQLGTPLSALMAWRDLFEAEGISKELITEFNKDIDRLSTITERFSKIGSETTLLEIPATDLVKETLNYLSKRISSEVKIQIIENTTSKVLVNAALFSWVIENLVKNSVDAMEAKGSISVRIHDHKNLVFIDVQDSGKGILKRKWKSIFEPGYTTKERGWGLGLSLAKRIVNTYHKGKISVVYSEIGKGTTIRIALKKAR